MLDKTLSVNHVVPATFARAQAPGQAAASRAAASNRPMFQGKITFVDLGTDQYTTYRQSPYGYLEGGTPAKLGDSALAFQKITGALEGYFRKLGYSPQNPFLSVGNNNQERIINIAAHLPSTYMNQGQFASLVSVIKPTFWDSVVDELADEQLLRPISEKDVPHLLDTIIIPAGRRIENLPEVLRLANFSQAQLVIIASQEASISSVKEQLIASGQDLKNITVIQASLNKEAALAKNTTRNRETVVADSFDLSEKRNLGIILSKMMGWHIVLFLDDDIKSLTPQMLAEGLRAMAKDPAHKIAGWRNIDKNPFASDNSFPILAARLAGKEQGTFISGASLLARVDALTPFFPRIYCEDWVFMLAQQASNLYFINPADHLFHYLLSENKQVNDLKLDRDDLLPQIEKKFDRITIEQLRHQIFGDIYAEGLKYATVTLKALPFLHQYLNGELPVAAKNQQEANEKMAAVRARIERYQQQASAFGDTSNDWLYSPNFWEWFQQTYQTQLHLSIDRLMNAFKEKRQVSDIKPLLADTANKLNIDPEEFDGGWEVHANMESLPNNVKRDIFGHQVTDDFTKVSKDEQAQLIVLLLCAERIVYRIQTESFIRFKYDWDRDLEEWHNMMQDGNERQQPKIRPVNAIDKINLYRLQKAGLDIQGLAHWDNVGQLSAYQVQNKKRGKGQQRLVASA